MIPSWKAPETEKFLEEQFGRTTAIQGDRCIPPPVGCGQPIAPFYGPINEKEYTISGLCQACQDLAFGDPRSGNYHSTEPDPEPSGRYFRPTRRPMKKRGKSVSPRLLRLWDPNRQADSSR